MTHKTPVLLLKTKSVPGDAYEELFSAPPEGPDFDPSFVPVLEHRFNDDGMAKVRTALQNQAISTAEGSTYGGLIFTSQRAVEAFTRLVEERRGETPVSAGWHPVAKVSNPQVKMAGLTSRTCPSTALVPQQRAP
jgi:uroporphyrinogen-III synthase